MLSEIKTMLHLSAPFCCYIYNIGACVCVCCLRNGADNASKTIQRIASFLSRLTEKHSKQWLDGQVEANLNDSKEDLEIPRSFTVWFSLIKRRPNDRPNESRRPQWWGSIILCMGRYCYIMVSSEREAFKNFNFLATLIWSSFFLFVPIFREISILLVRFF